MLLASVGLVVLAGILMLRGETGSGDVAAVEAALRPETSAPVDLGPAPTTTLSPNDSNGADQEPADESAAPVTANPVGLRINKLGVDAPVDAYGVDQATGDDLEEAS